VSGNGLERERVSGIQRARLLAAVTEVACERGAGNVTVAHVVERAGVSRRTFYELFEDREDCFLAAFDEAVARASGCVLDAYDPDAKWEVRIRASLAAVLWFLDVERDAGRLLIVESLGAGAKALERRKCVLDRMVAVVEEGGTESRSGASVRVRVPSGEAPSSRAKAPSSEQAEPLPLMAEGVVGGVLSVLHARLLESHPGRLVELTGPLVSMIVLPYLGAPAARRELARRPVPLADTTSLYAARDPLRGLEMRLTYRTVRVLLSVAAKPGSSNREVGDASGIADQGQISKLLSRLERLGLVRNAGLAPGRGAPNEWTLTPKGLEVERAMSTGAMGDGKPDEAQQASVGSSR